MSDSDRSKCLYVSPRGSDSNPGTPALPLKTLERARDEVRKINGNMTGDIYIYLLEGRYVLDSTFILNSLDSGTNGFNIIYSAYGEAAPEISGGVDISQGWTVYDSDRNIYQRTGVDWSFRQLYATEKRAIRARKPNLEDEMTGGPYLYAENGTYPYKIKAEDLGPWANNGTAEMVIVNSWNHQRGRVAYSAQNTIYFRSPENGFAFNHHDQNPAPYFIENDLELLDAEGEWFLDTETETLYYKPRQGEVMNSSVIIAPKLETLVKIEGTAANSRVHHIKFEGITFCHSNWLAPDSFGYVDMQAGIRYQTASGGSNSEIRSTARYSAPNSMLQLKYCRDITLSGNTFRFAGGWAVMGYEGTERTMIAGNSFHQNAGGGIALGIAGDRWDDGEDPFYNRPDGQSRYDTISNNSIDWVALDYKDMVGIAAMLPQNITVSDNEVKNLPYTGISVGWNWSDNDHGMVNNRIFNNRIHHVLKLLQDGAGIYSLGRMDGDSRFYSNYIDEISQSEYAASYYLMGIYLDNGSCNKILEGNVIDNVPHAFNICNPPNHDNIVRFNYYSCNLGFISGANKVEGNQCIPDRQWPKEARDIISTAGTK